MHVILVPLSPPSRQVTRSNGTAARLHALATALAAAMREHGSA
jgi:hypothetical protein